MYYVLLVLFGVLGASLRYAIGLWMNAGFPLATLAVNVVGCFLLAFFSKFLYELPYLSKKLASAIGTGFVGSFTTFSTFALESSELIYWGDYIVAFGYMLTSLVGGLAACVLGYQMGEVLLRSGGRR